MKDLKLGQYAGKGFEDLVNHLTYHKKHAKFTNEVKMYDLADDDIFVGNVFCHFKEDKHPTYYCLVSMSKGYEKSNDSNNYSVEIRFRDDKWKVGSSYLTQTNTIAQDTIEKDGLKFLQMISHMTPDMMKNMKTTKEDILIQIENLQQDAEEVKLKIDNLKGLLEIID